MSECIINLKGEVKVMRDTTLVVMAAGMGSRYGGIKQLDAFGPEGEVIMDYSIFDAVKAGFNKVVVIIREDILEDFMEVIGNRLEEKAGVPVHYVFQDPNRLPEGFSYPEGRKKPWGTGQAVLAVKELVHEPFLVINADDFYGREPYQKVHDFLTEVNLEEEKAHFCMAGYCLGNTLSDNGSVARGICKVSDEGKLLSIEETLSIEKTEKGVVGEFNGKKVDLSLDDVASMNMMGFTPAIFDYLEKAFVSFLQNLSNTDPMKAEFFLPMVVGDMIAEKKADMQVIRTDERWFGVTYQEDKPEVKEALQKLVEDGVYGEPLWDHK